MPPRGRPVLRSWSKWSPSAPAVSPAVRQALPAAFRAFPLGDGTAGIKSQRCVATVDPKLYPAFVSGPSTAMDQDDPRYTTVGVPLCLFRHPVKGEKAR